MNGSTDALICSATADIPRHRRVNIGIAGLRRGHQQRSRGHDLARLAVAALHHIEIEPRPLQRSTLRRRTYPLDGGDGALADAADRRNAGSTRYAVDNHRAGAAQCNPAAELGTGHTKNVTQDPEQWGIALDLDLVRRPVDSDSEGHHYLERDLRFGRERNNSMSLPLLCLLPILERCANDARLVSYLSNALL
jgi:hypothetical protein